MPLPTGARLGPYEVTGALGEGGMGEVYRARDTAFGVVLFEMLTGRPLHQGESVSEVLAAVIKDTPDLSVLPATTPQALREILTRCLERDPHKRLRDIGEARILLEAPRALDPAATAAPVPPATKGRSSFMWAASLAGALAIGAGAAWRGH